MEAFHQSGGGECFTAKCDEEAFDRCPILGTTDKFSTIILAHLFCPFFVDKSSTEHHSASGLPPQSDEKIYANLTDFILSVVPLVAILIGPATNNTYFLYFFLCLSSPASLRHACKRIWFTRMLMFVGAMAAPSASAFHAPV